MDKHNYYKLIMSYGVLNDQLQGYYQFVMGKYLPAMQEFGFEMTEAWSTAWGDAPGRQVAFVARDRETVDYLIANPAWDELNDELSNYVDDFIYKFVPYREGFQF